MKSLSKILNIISNIIIIAYTLFLCCYGIYFVIMIINKSTDFPSFVFFLVLTIIFIIPYIILYHYNKKKDKKLFIIGVVYQFIVLLVITLFLFVIWPGIKSSITNNDMVITEYNSSN